MTKAKVIVLFFSRDALLQTEEEKKLTGQLYLEKRPRGKFLCFKKGETTTEVSLTKKMYKNLNRFTSGIVMERFYDIETDDMAGVWDQDDDISEDDIYYVMGGRHLNPHGRQITFPINIPPKSKEKAVFVMQMFKYKEKK